MKAFLATNYDGDIRKNPEFSSDYADLPWEYLEKMSQAEVESAYFKAEHPFPNATVAAGDHIWYTDTSWKQIDFYIVRDFTNQKMYYAAMYFLEGFTWYRQIIAGRNVEFISFATEHDEEGKEVISKGGTGGRVYFIPLNETDKLVIVKQAKGDEAFERDFRNLIQTLKISP